MDSVQTDKGAVTKLADFIFAEEFDSESLFADIEQDIGNISLFVNNSAFFFVEFYLKIEQFVLQNKCM